MGVCFRGDNSGHDKRTSRAGLLANNNTRVELLLAMKSGGVRLEEGWKG